jgi:Holliday junction resolvasome RuvABC DNA-binding subunit
LHGGFSNLGFRVMQLFSSFFSLTTVQCSLQHLPTTTLENYKVITKPLIQQSHLYYGFVKDSFRFVLRKLYTEPSIGASYQLSINLVKWF